MSKQTGKTTSSIDRVLPWLFIGGGLVGFIASFTLTLDKIRLLQNPNYSPPCNINPIISCGSVMKTAQASVFGFTNSIIGVVAFTGLVTIGLAVLARAKFNKWFWLFLQAGVTFGVIFVHWLIFQSLYRIGSLCPYCMAVWAVTIPIFWYVTLYNLTQGNIPGISLKRRAIAFTVKHHGNILLIWFLIIISLIMQRFWYYFGF